MPPIGGLNAAILPNFEACAFCMKRAKGLANPLRKCAGCSIALYCSKECQRSAWPSHKGSGAGTESAGDLYGYPTVMALSMAIKEWSQLHEHTFNIIANLMVYASGGVEHVLRNPRALLVRVRARPGAIDSNPAFKFYVDGADVLHRDDSRILGDGWDTMMAECRKEAARARRKDASAPWAGILPTVFHALSKPSVISLTQYAIYRFQLEDCHRTPLDPQMHAVFMDHVEMCAMSMSLGHVYLRPPNSELLSGRFLPPVMQMVRSNKHWRRVPIEGVDDYWDTIAALMASQPERFTSGLQPRELWAHFLRACFVSRATEHNAA
ncbi:hypothetical protein OH76DRAFT_1480384 [Lentinus brumalis]|uniref:MYND-type domain-containing protein n=1 Tax=Lentinus brumalis TaxID=2498619 RepID=A0A371DJR4_9APHY|nr:hypothetical protein OH76DRAFT_1480384 [Polyporus brumalis]